MYSRGGPCLPEQSFSSAVAAGRVPQNPAQTSVLSPVSECARQPDGFGKGEHSREHSLD